MAILRGTEIGHAYGAVDLFWGVSIAVPRRARIGLVGPNGCGKTTLLLILAKRLTPSRGRVAVAKGVRIGYLPQQAPSATEEGEKTLYDSMLEAVAPLPQQEMALEALAAALGHEPQDRATLERYGHLQAAFEQAGGYEYRTRIRQVLAGLGFEQTTYSQPVRQLSGGQRTRAMLASLLLAQPDLLMLDEPTNQLDLEAIEWLEGFLSGYAGAVILVSHDRTFLDRVVDTIWELGSHGIEAYRGNYSAYSQCRDERWARRRKQYDAFVSRSQEELDLIRRNIAAQNTGMAVGRLTRLGRQVDAVLAAGFSVLDEIERSGWARATAGLAISKPARRVEELASRLAQIPAPRSPEPPFHLALAPHRRGGDWVVRAKDLAVGFTGRPLLTAPALEVRRGERVAILGGNGSGKTTLLRTLLGELPPLAGTVRLGANLDIGYLPQSPELDDAGTVLEVVTDLVAGNRMQAMSYLARFRFAGDVLHRPVTSLSGGERTRLALARLSLCRPNCLFLDEPTHHLDLPSQEALQAVLERFTGAILLVSHDRYLVDRLATQVWEIDAGRLEVFAGRYREYVAARRSPPASNDACRDAVAGKTVKLARSRAGGLSKNQLQRLELRRAELEARIAELEQAAETTARQLQRASESGQFTEIERLSRDYEALRAQVEAAYDDWAATSALIDERPGAAAS